MFKVEYYKLNEDGTRLNPNGIYLRVILKVYFINKEIRSLIFNLGINLDDEERKLYYKVILNNLNLLSWRSYGVAVSNRKS